LTSPPIACNHGYYYDVMETEASYDAKTAKPFVLGRSH
jgi:hypothetical protein